MNKRQLNQKFAVITGSTQGLGEATAREFAERGAAGLVICGRNTNNGENVARELTKEGCPTQYVRADLSQVEDCYAVMAKADSTFGRVDILVNAAGITDRGGILDTTPDLLDHIFAINVKAPFFMMQAAARIMRREKIAGTMVNIISMSAHGGQSFLSAYSSSKGALAILTRNVAYSLLGDQIRVNGLNLGWMDTPGEHRIQKEYHKADDNWLGQAESSQPFKRLLKPREVARVIAFLASDESGMMTGSIIDFDQNIVGCHD